MSTTPPADYPHLSKSRFQAGLQCLKRLYLEDRTPELADPIGPAQQAVFASGNAVGALARDRFAAGRLIQEPYNNHSGAEASTKVALADNSIRALFEAAFMVDGIRIRVDVLSRVEDGGFDLIEVKSSTRVKEEHISDAAIQLKVLEDAGLRITRVFLLHIDNSYVYEGGEYDLAHLFKMDEVTSEVREYLPSIPNSLEVMSFTLMAESVPEISVGPHCGKPYLCPYYGHCHRDLPDHYVEQLPRANEKLLRSLVGAGIQDIRDIPADFPALTKNHHIVREAVIKGTPHVGSDLARDLALAKVPLHFLDFETYNPALPLYVGTHPYQIIPFQWCLQIQDANGSFINASFLQDGPDDPREAFVTSLLDAVKPEGSIVVYSGYEKTILNQLAEYLPPYRERLLALCDRLYDLLEVLRRNYYHPDFHGSYSIKSVLPALVPAMTYKDLDIRHGTEASVAFAEMISPDTSNKDRERIREELLAYCAQDTIAMARILDVLRMEAERHRSAQ